MGQAGEKPDRDAPALTIASAPSEERVLLTRRQIEVMQYIANGKKNEDIAELMAITVHVVQLDVVQACNALGCANRSSLVAWALRRGIIK